MNADRPTYPQRASSKLEVLVVGAGMVGAACAEALARAGARVRLFEAGLAAGEATAAGMGHILVLDDSEAQLALTKRSRELWDQREFDWPREVEREACGTLWVAADEAEMQIAADKAAWLQARGVTAELLDGKQLALLEPHLRPGLAGALRLIQDSVVYPPAAAQHLLKTAGRLGCDFHAHTPVQEVGDGWIQLPSGVRIVADAVVVAAGLRSLELLSGDLRPVRALLLPKKGHLAISDRSPGFLRHQIVELGYHQSAHGAADVSVAFNVQPRSNGQVLIGSSRQVGVGDRRVEPEVLARMLRRALEYMPDLGGLSMLRSWVGVRPASADNLPLLGLIPGATRTYIAAGHEGLGITTSLASAELITSALLGQTPSIAPEPYSPARFADFGARVCSTQAPAEAPHTPSDPLCGVRETSTLAQPARAENSTRLPGEEGPQEFEVRVDGRPWRARRGQSVAALLLSGPFAASRRSVTGARRGPLCGMGTCHECRVDLPGQAQVRACLVPCTPGLQIQTGLALGSPAATTPGASRA